MHFLMGHLGNNKAKELRGTPSCWPGRCSFPGIKFCSSSISTHWTMPCPCSKSCTKCKTLASSQTQSPTILPLPPSAPATWPTLPFPEHQTVSHIRVFACGSFSVRDILPPVALFQSSLLKAACYKTSPPPHFLHQNLALFLFISLIMLEFVLIFSSPPEGVFSEGKFYGFSSPQPVPSTGKCLSTLCGRIGKIKR